MARKRFLLVLTLLVVCCALAMIGTTDSRVNLSSVLAIFSDVARDTDQVGMRLTRLKDAEENRIGEELVRSSGQSSREDAGVSAYVADVARDLISHVRRRGIHYRFHVIEAEPVNAFALPGGQIFVTTGLIRFLRSEAELAAVVGHEISHVDLRHCVERYQYENKLKKAGVPDLGWMVEMAHRLATIEFAADQELEADAEGNALATGAGYDPDAAEALFMRMKAEFHESSLAHATTPGGELRQSVGGAIGAIFRTHPLSEERARKLHELVQAQRHALAGKRVYVGVENLRRRTVRFRLILPEEFREL